MVYRARSWLLAAWVVAGPVAAAPPSIAAFAARLPVEHVTVSPDGGYLAMVRTDGTRAAVVIIDRRPGASHEPRTVMGEPEHFRVSWCRFATDTRLLCGFRATTTNVSVAYSVTRLAAVDADGGNMKVLLQNDLAVQGQYQDGILHWHPGPPDTVLIEADEGLDSALAQMVASGGATIYGDYGSHGAPAVWELNVRSGRLKLRQRARPPVVHWAADPSGQVRLGWGQDGATVSYLARRDGETEWRRLEHFEVFSRDLHFDPLAISHDQPNLAYASAPSEGRDALWLIDLTDQKPPELAFAHPQVDIAEPLLADDGRLLGVEYETDYPNTYFLSARAKSVVEAVKKARPGLYTKIAEVTRDERVYVLASYGDRQPARYSVFDVGTGTLAAIGSPPPGLDPEALGRMTSISYPARDGTEIPGYLTLPPGAATKHLPLIVMPHGGPIARDEWGYDFLVQFFASRGYAVLQMNFRGSGGYGSDWFFAAHQDWGGLTYDDVVDGTRWAVAQGIADPARVAIVGWSFGGYLALVGAQRDGDLFRCAVSIAGVSDLSLHISERRRFMNAGEVASKQIGTDPAKLAQNSPRLHAAEFRVPVLMVHGDLDPQVQVEQSRAMDSALAHAKKPHRLVEIKDADHQLWRTAERVRLLTEIEGFLAERLGPAPR